MKKETWILLAVILASGVAFLDGSVVNLALPAFQKDFGATVIDLQWVINGYTLALASLLLIGGRLGDYVGQRRVFSWGIVLFTLASVLCARASSIDQLIWFRAVQGIGAALMIPGSLAIIMTNFAENRRGQIFGLWAGITGGMAAAGSFFGGWLIQTFNWPSIFYVNVIIGALALWATLTHVPESTHHGKEKLDWWGTLLITLGLVGICFGLIEGPALGWASQSIITSLVVGVLALIIFVFVEAKIQNPLVPLSIFKNWLVSGSNLVTLFLYFALNSTFVLLALNLQQIQGYSPSHTALALVAFPLILLFLSGPAGKMADRIGPRQPMIWGPIVVSAAMALLAVSGVGRSYVVAFLPGIILWALGMCLIIAPLTKSAMSVEGRLAGAASGINNAVSRIAALLAIAVFGAVMIVLFTAQIKVALADTTLDLSMQTHIASQSNKLAGLSIPSEWTKIEQTEAHQSVQTAFLYGYKRLMLLNAALALLSGLIASATIRSPKKDI